MIKKMCIRDSNNTYEIRLSKPMDSLSHIGMESVTIYFGYEENTYSEDRTTVSYTHLDVYKRQWQERRLGIFGPSLSIRLKGLSISRMLH